MTFSLARLLELTALALDTVSVYQNYRSFTPFSNTHRSLEGQSFLSPLND